MEQARAEYCILSCSHFLSLVSGLQTQVGCQGSQNPSSQRVFDLTEFFSEINAILLQK